jgi:hypothetical protein
MEETYGVAFMLLNSRRKQALADSTSGCATQQRKYIQPTNALLSDFTSPVVAAGMIG